MTKEKAIEQLEWYFEEDNGISADLVTKQAFNIIKGELNINVKNIKEIAEIMECDADAETKCKMISNILTAKPHYFEEQDPCEKCNYVEGSPFCLQYCPYDAERKKEQQPCGDAISREDALNGVDAMYNNSWNLRDFRQNVDLMVKELPPVTQKSGKWIKKEYWKPLPYDTEPLDYDNYDEKTHSEKVYHYYCSECDRDEGETKPTDKYCPNCGAKMESED